MKLLNLLLLIVPAFWQLPVLAETPAHPSPLMEILSKNPCASGILKQLNSWESLFEWSERPNLDPFQPTRSFLSPTKTIGRWTEVRIHSEKEATLILFQSGKSETIAWSESCHQEARTTQTSNSAHIDRDSTNNFSDQDLKSFLEQNEKGLVFVWSPHMPCSVKGLHAIQKTAETLHLPLLALLDPASNIAFAKRHARKEKFPESVLRPVHSLELILRGMTNYPPALQVFSNKKFRGPIFRGFQDNTNYQRFVESNL